MTSIFNKIKKVLVPSAALLFTLNSSLLTMSSCVEPESTLVEFVEDNKLNTPNDTLFSLMGIISKMQVIADRTVLLGELRGDLTTLTQNANLNLQEIANFNVSPENPYNEISDYYAIIQNCNYYLANVDTLFTKRGEKIFKKEYVVVKSYRAWTYLQLALNYGAVPFFTEPILTEKDADVNKYPKYNVEQIADYFIKDIVPYVDTEYPNYGAMGSYAESRNFYIPVRVLLGDLCLWAGKYADAAKYYHDYLTKSGDTHPIGNNSVEWADYRFQIMSDSYALQFNLKSEIVSAIPMESSKYNGLVSDLENVFSSTLENNYFYQATHSAAHDNLSMAQKYAYLRVDPVTMLPDTLYNDTVFYEDRLKKGDLRLLSTYSLRRRVSSSSNESDYSMQNYKYVNPFVIIYRLKHVYLRYAEALNRAGYPNAGFAVLKYGMCKDYIDMYIPEDEREAAKALISFNEYIFTRENTKGIHSSGSGDANCNKYYVIPECATKADSILAVENLICDEMALETACEGTRYYDLMRISLHRNDPTFLAGKVANRDGVLNSGLYSKLSDKANWYLPIK